VQYALQVFDYKQEDDHHDTFRTINIDGEPWFVLADVCRALDLKPNKGSFFRHAEKLDPDERKLVLRSFVETPPRSDRGGLPAAPVQGASVLIINESGLYTLILRSDKPEARHFKRWVTSEVLPTIRRTGGYGRGRGTPAFIHRFNQNWDRVSPGHFSVISELTVRLWGRLEQVGHIMADRARDGTELRPDVSVGRRFADWLREEHPGVNHEFSYYPHWTPQTEIEARQYKNSMWPLFAEFVDTVWIERHSEEYFRTRDPAALPYLPKLLPGAGARTPIAPPRQTGLTKGPRRAA
jgi:prophage antirepressor-like protein